MSRLPLHLKPIITIKIIDQTYPSSEIHPTPSSLNLRKIGTIEPTISHSIIRQDTTVVLPSIFKKDNDLLHISPPQLQRNPKKRKRSSKDTLIVLAKEFKSIIQIKLIKIVYSSKPISLRDLPISMRLLMAMVYLGILSRSLSLKTFLGFIRINLKALNWQNRFLKCSKKFKRT